MRYFIGNQIRGEAAEYYKTTCEDFANRFGVENVAEIVPPHITVKSPFERPNTESIEEVLSLFTESPAIPFTLSGWNHFTNRTIFLDAPETSAELRNFIKAVQDKFRGMGIPVTPQETSSHIHMSVARFLRNDQYNAIWKYLQSTPSPKFDLMFDNLTIFVKERKEEKSWKILKTFPLIGKR